MIGLKAVLAFSSLNMVATPLTVVGYSTTLNSIENSIEFENLYNSIKDNAKPVDQIEKWSIDGLDFYSEDELYLYLTEMENIKELQTSSNPNKIIKDAGNGILDETKIYDLEQENFQRIYRDAFGNVSINKEAALSTYVNGGSVTHKYSYDNLNWFDSPEEAKNDYVYQGGLHKSLYYYINGRYYNVFNKEDESALKNILKEGYRVSASEITGQNVLYGTKKTIQDTIEATLRTPWTKSKNSLGENDLNYENFIDLDVEKWFRFTTTKGIDFKIHYNDGSESITSSVGQNIKFDDSSITREILISQKNWREVNEQNKNRRYHYYFENSGIDKKVNKKFSKIEYYPAKKGKKNTPAKVNFSLQSVEELGQTNVKLFADFNNKNLLSDIKLTRIVSNYQDLSTQEVNDLYKIWYNDFKIKKLFKDIPDEITSETNISDVNRPMNKYNVAKDYLYDVNGQQGEKYSYYESQYNYHKKNKHDILNGETRIENNEVVYKIRDDFWATKEQVENYTFLYGDMDVRLMYTHIDQQDISSQDGLVLSSTEAEARRKMFEYESAILLNRYFAYDVFGNFESSAESGDEAIKAMRKKVNLTSKFINKKEIDSWNGQPRSYSEIVQDGVYTIYGISSINSVGGKIYFYSYLKALEAVMEGISHSTQYSNELINIYMYTNIDKDGNSKVYTFRNDYELKKIVEEILQ
ncbi:hypothetical protein [Spiroplasma endosymbiont of Cantharis rufa]|uniref:hypothetical protein n=1 Tax=Spiroplasma endosymbiont of Cantharis rufa TaxID=3066279 RepID=UPI0030CD5B9C